MNGKPALKHPQKSIAKASFSQRPSSATSMWSTLRRGNAQETFLEQILHDLERTSKQNWDGEDAAPIKPDVRLRVEDVVNDLIYASNFQLHPIVPPSAFGATLSGGYTLVWRYKNLWLHLEFSSDGVDIFGQDQHGQPIMVELSGEVAPFITQAVKKLLKSATHG